MNPENRKFPWLAVSFSLMLPGLGQIYARAIVPGVAIMAAWAILTSGAVCYLFSLAVGLFLLYALLGFGVWLFGLVHAGLSARNYNRMLGFPPLTGKNPWFAVFLSIIVPGLGHLYCGRVVLGILAIVVWSLLGLPMRVSLWFFSLPPVYTVLVAVHAHSVTPESKARRRGMKLFVVTALILLTVGAALFTIAYSITPPDLIQELKLKLIPGPWRTW